MLIIVELLFAALMVTGVAFVYWPAAMILAGVLGVWACERAAARRAVRPAPVTRLRDAA